MTATLAFGSWNFPHGKGLFTVCTYSGLQRHCSLCPGAVTFQHAILGMDQKETAFVTLVGWWAGGLVVCGGCGGNNWKEVDAVARVFPFSQASRHLSLKFELRNRTASRTLQSRMSGWHWGSQASTGRKRNQAANDEEPCVPAERQGSRSLRDPQFKR
jgi:hypothetical protein